MPPLSVFGTDVSIRENHYSLNDLHRAAGGSQNHKPTIFLRNDQTKALIAEIEKGENSHLLATEVIKGRNGGTYVCKELVYAYAMWISPKFHLAVIRAFDQFAGGGNMMAAQQPAPAGQHAYDPKEFYIIHKSSLETGACVCTPNQYGTLTTSPIPPESVALLKAARGFIDGVKQEGYMLIKPEDLFKKLAL